MKNSPFSIHNLNPNLVDSVERAFQRNVEAGRVVGDEFSGGLAKEGLADILKQKATENRKNTAEYSPALDVIKNPEIREQFANAFALETALFERIRLPVPDPQMFAESGVDFTWFADMYNQMNKEKINPTIVIAPYHGSLEVWDMLYWELSQDPSTSLGSEHSTGLYISNNVAAGWNEIDQLPDASNDLPTVTFAPALHHLPETEWTIRLIPGNDIPDQFNLRHSALDHFHTTVAEYLTLQATRVQANMPLIDQKTATWLSGIIDGDHVPYGCYSDSLSHVSIGAYYKDYVSDSIGNRQPQW